MFRCTICGGRHWGKCPGVELLIAALGALERTAIATCEATVAIRGAAARAPSLDASNPE